MTDQDGPAASARAVDALALATVAQLDDIIEDLSAASDDRAAAKLWMAARGRGVAQEAACLTIMGIRGRAVDGPGGGAPT